MSGIIYKIICNDTNECYVGSTIRPLKERINGHKRKHNNCVSRTIIDRGNYKTEIIEAVNFGENKKLLLLKEREWMEKLKSINTKRPIMSREERLQEQRDLMKKKYSEDPEHRKRRDDKCKAYRQTDAGKEKKKKSDKKYREGEKREEILEKKRVQSKEARKKNKDKSSQVIKCECGFTYTFQHKARHMKTLRHCKIIQSI